MKRYAFLLIVILLAGAMAGCLGGGGSGVTPSTTTESEGTAPTTTTTQQTTTTPSQTATETPAGPDVNALLQEVSRIQQFTYTSNASLEMLVTIEGNGTSQGDNVTLRILERGYMDFESWSAWINSTTVSLPDGARTNTSRIVVENVTYIQTIVGWVRTEDSDASDILWRYSIVGLAREYLREKPDSVETGAVTKLIYRIPDYRLKPLATVYFAASPDTVVYVKDGRLELWFSDGRLIGGRLSFSVSSETNVDDPTLGKMTIKQDGKWNETFEIDSINEKRNVREPST
ncbi:hypothetical protein GQS_07315 [Thermococcus sp. 4557]|uniref:hypothetical protein n=1 Tax=Thermococcus sp. (strain CGMCC 1.5172 / 4557) TaxID=1042877 RepID=UPI000219EB5E|nr:hypothetical protein [Thermococcus sp. 4557]AEK73361.1 hypothetical protein GQS_07315 [Thermococcus sp. 4557]